MYRDHKCGELSAKNIGEDVRLAGWVAGIRDFGSLAFVDLRDISGIIQLSIKLVPDSALTRNFYKIARESVIQVDGCVLERSSKNPRLKTGDIEIGVTGIKILSSAEDLPFLPNHDTDIREDLTLKYRYIALRDKNLQRNIKMRHEIALLTRNYLSNSGFLEIETPFLIKSTPEGARDFLVPSRITPGRFYALPQSPQMFKQLLMVAGFDRYFQIVRCFRDEDLRADRQPEFTQLDCEMSFVTQEQVLEVFEKYAVTLFEKISNIRLPKFKRLSYRQALETYGSDKPDLRFDMPLVDITKDLDMAQAPLFQAHTLLLALVAKGGAAFTRRQLDALAAKMKSQQVQANGVVHFKVASSSEYSSTLLKYYSQDQLHGVCAKLGAEVGDIVFMMYGKAPSLYEHMGALRLEVASMLDLTKPNTFAPLWVTDFPMFEKTSANKIRAMHHPFTSPKLEDIPNLFSDTFGVRADAYDMVINGVELGGGSIRITDPELQAKVFSVLGLSERECNEQFGFLLKAFKSGVPPHGGIAFGFDRVVAMLLGENTIRDVIPFPKNNAAVDLMLDAPSPVVAEQLHELGLQLEED